MLRLTMTDSQSRIQTDPPRRAHSVQLLSDAYGVGTRVSLRDAAEKLEIARTELNDILCGKAPITLPVALRIAEHFGGSAAAWQRETQPN